MDMISFMSIQVYTSHIAVKPGSKPPSPVDFVELDYEERYLRRKVLTCLSGDEVLVDLPKAVVLTHGDRLLRDDGQAVEVIAGKEDLIDVRAGDRHGLVQLAYHLGNRHLPVQIESHRLVIKADHVIEDMLRKMGAKTCCINEPFHPEGGAYGLGRTHGHDHGHSHDHG